MSGPRMPLSRAGDEGASGRAALSLLESLVLTLLERRLVAEHEIDAMFEAAIAAHRAQAAGGPNPELHQKIVKVLTRMQAQAGAWESGER